jgi:hypothetical protein
VIKAPCRVIIPVGDFMTDKPFITTDIDIIINLCEIMIRATDDKKVIKGINRVIRDAKRVLDTAEK